MKLLTCNPYGMHTFIYVFAGVKKKWKKKKPSEYGNVISVGTDWGATVLAHYARTGRCINKSDVFTPMILL